MTEEQVTKALLNWLIQNEWKIICFDFPQSGTGIMLHPDNSFYEKNRDGIIPDIVAVKHDVGLFFENKDRFFLPDYQKICELRTDNKYTNAIKSLLNGIKLNSIYYGIGLPTKKHTRRSVESAFLVDFIIGVDEDYLINILHSTNSLMNSGIIKL